jgi:large subunit ribosomal protein L6
MSRIANAPITLPKGVDVTSDAAGITVKSGNTSLSIPALPGVGIAVEDGVARVTLADGGEVKYAGTTRALVNNMVHGVTEGFQRKLQLMGVGFRAAVQGNKLNLTLGFSHPVDYAIPEGIVVETPSATEIVVKGADKQRVGQVAANIRALRPPEPYKGKGVRFEGEYINRKEAKKA